jgi:hypothetical protein
MGAGCGAICHGAQQAFELGGSGQVHGGRWYELIHGGRFLYFTVCLFQALCQQVHGYYAAAERLGLAVILLNLSSVGTFLHTGLKLPLLHMVRQAAIRRL